MSCTGSAPTFHVDPPSVSHDGSSCQNTIHVLLDSTCGATGYTVLIYRYQFSTPTLISTQSIPDGPLSAYDISYVDSPPCGTGNVGYYAQIYCAAVFQSVSLTTTVSQGSAPSLSNDNISSVACANTLSIDTTLTCGTCGGNVKLYRTQGSSPTFAGGEVIYTDTISNGPLTHHSSYIDTPPCVRGTYYYQWRIELPSGNTTGTVHTANSGGAATIDAFTTTLHGDCTVTCNTQVSKPCGECAGSIKLYRNGSLIFTDVVPAGPLIGSPFSYTDSPGDGSWTYQWKVFNDTVGEDAASAFHTEAPACDVIVYNPYTTALPEGEMEKQIVLVHVTRGGARGYVYTDTRILNLQEQRAEWWIHKNGGCGAFRFLTHDDFPEMIDDDDLTDSWELHVRIKLAGETVYTTWYRGIVRSVKIEEQGAEQFTDMRGYGYVELLDNVQIQKQYPAGMTVKQIVDDIIDSYIKPGTRIRRASDVDVTNGSSGVDASSYVNGTPIHFECSALKALKFLAELQGNREFGVDANGYIYFRQNISAIIYNFFLSKDIVKKISGGKTFIQANEMKVAGKSFGARDFLQIRPDVTDISYNGVYESPVEVPWVTGDKDASTWADNVIAKNKGQQKWSVFTWKGVTRRLDSANPIGKIQVYGDDISNDVETYDIAKIQYVEGGWITKQELREMGSPSIQPELDQQLLKATFYVGYYPRDLVEEIEVRLREQIEFLKGRHKQYRYPNDVTNTLKDPVTNRDVPGKIPGEIKHFRPAPLDPTNYDVTNNINELQDITNPRGILVAWLDNQYVKLALSRTFNGTLPTRGKYIGEIVNVITDITHQQFGVTYIWNGASWSLIGSGSSGGGGGTVSFGTPVDITNANADGVATTAARSDHRHRGIRTVKVKGQADIDGYVDITAGLYIRVTQSGQTLTFDVDALVAYINTLALAAYNPISDPVFWALMG